MRPTETTPDFVPRRWSWEEVGVGGASKHAGVVRVSACGGAREWATGRDGMEPRLADGATAWEPVWKVVVALPIQTWKRLAVGHGEKGRRLCDWARMRILDRRAAVPGPQGWFLARRSITDPPEAAYYLSSAPHSTLPCALAEVEGARWSMETSIEECKGETGRDEYEVRHWHSWQRQITVCLLAQASLASIRQPLGRQDLQTQRWRN